MDDTFKTYFASFLLSFALLASLTGQAAELEFISQDQANALGEQFSGAGTPTETLFSRKKNWTCDMYGVRTRLQVQRGVKLYEWSSEKGAWKNGGAQPVIDYRLDKGTFSGRGPKVEDQIRATKEGRLISRLSSADDSHKVIAYSVCTAL